MLKPDKRLIKSIIISVIFMPFYTLNKALNITAFTTILIINRTILVCAPDVLPQIVSQRPHTIH